MEASEKRRIVEALILSSSEPISAAKLAEIIPYCDAGQAKDLVNELNTEYGEQDRSFEIWEVAGGFQIRTRAEFSGYLQKLQKERALRLSPAALETLAIIAYRQPTTRAEIEDVRGVDAGATVKSLLERHLIRIAGQREVPGRPMVYGTTRRFLEVFGLERLKDLPTLRELDELAREQGLLEKSGEAADGAEPGTEGATEATITDSGVAGESEESLIPWKTTVADVPTDSPIDETDAPPATETVADDSEGVTLDAPEPIEEIVESVPEIAAGSGDSSAARDSSDSSAEEFIPEPATDEGANEEPDDDEPVLH
jgi:segregation and condensation protein B